MRKALEEYRWRSPVRFASKVYQDAPGGHGFNRIDTAFARESDAEVYAFRARDFGSTRPCAPERLE